MNAALGIAIFYNSAKRLQLSFLICLLYFLIPIAACRKAPHDPWLSLRSRDNRLVGTWIYSDTINGHSVSYKISINIDGKVNAMSATTSGIWGKDTSVHLANWFWAYESDRKVSKTRFIFEYENHIVKEYNIISLRHNEVKLWYLKDVTNPTRVSYMTLIRQK